MSFDTLLKSTINTYAKSIGAEPDLLETWTLTDDSIKAGIQQLSGIERVIDTGKDIVADMNVIVKASTIVEGDRIKWGDKMMEVVHVDNPMERGHHKEYKCVWLPAVDPDDYADE